MEGVAESKVLAGRKNSSANQIMVNMHGKAWLWGEFDAVVLYSSGGSATTIRARCMFSTGMGRLLTG